MKQLLATVVVLVSFALSMASCGKGNDPGATSENGNNNTLPANK